MLSAPRNPNTHGRGVRRLRRRDAFQGRQREALGVAASSTSVEALRPVTLLKHSAKAFEVRAPSEAFIKICASSAIFVDASGALSASPSNS